MRTNILLRVHALCGRQQGSGPNHQLSGAGPADHQLSVRTEDYRNAAGYVDRILGGEKSANLPVQAPTKYETVLNMKTVKALGLEVPASVFARADEVIE